MRFKDLARAALLVAVAASSSGCALFRPKPPEYDPVTFDSGLVVQDLVQPETHLMVKAGDQVTFHYEIALEDGTIVDSSLERGKPIDIRLLPGEIELTGLAQGLLGMRVLGRRRLFVPPDLGYGAKGMPPRVPPDAHLVIDLELLRVNDASGP